MAVAILEYQIRDDSNFERIWIVFNRYRLNRRHVLWRLSLARVAQRCGLRLVCVAYGPKRKRPRGGANGFKLHAFRVQNARTAHCECKLRTSC